MYFSITDGFGFSRVFWVNWTNNFFIAKLEECEHLGRSHFSGVYFNKRKAPLSYKLAQIKMPFSARCSEVLSPNIGGNAELFCRRIRERMWPVLVRCVYDWHKLWRKNQVLNFDFTHLNLQGSLSVIQDHAPLSCAALPTCKKLRRSGMWAKVLPSTSRDTSSLSPEPEQGNKKPCSLSEKLRKPKCSRKIVLAWGLADGGWWSRQKECGAHLLLPLLFLLCHCHVTIKKERGFSSVIYGIVLLVWFCKEGLPVFSVL